MVRRVEPASPASSLQDKRCRDLAQPVLGQAKLIVLGWWQRPAAFGYETVMP